MDLDAFNKATTELTHDYFKKYGFFRQQVESYDRFMEKTLPEIFLSIEPLIIICGRNKIEIKFGRTTILPMYQREQDGVVRPSSPEECRQRKLTYQNGVVVDINQKSFQKNDKDEWICQKCYDFLEVPVFKIPCMVRTKFCQLYNKVPDHVHDFVSGYFIINGMEKTVQAQIKLRANSIHVFKLSGTKFNFFAEVRSSNESQWKATSSLRINVSPTPKDTFGTCIILDRPDLKKYNINSQIPIVTATLPFLCVPIPLALMFQLLRIDLTKEMLERASRCYDDDDDTTMKSDLDFIFLNIIQKSDESYEELLLRIGKEGTKEKTPEKRRAYIIRTMKMDVLPHLGTDDNEETRYLKAIYICIMTIKVIRSYLFKLKGNENGLVDDRDNWRFKKVDCTGTLIAILVRQLMRTFVGALKSSIYKAMDLGTSSTTLRVIDGFINSKKLETNIRYHFATGAWTVMRGVSPSACTGVCAPLTRITPVATISASNRINCPVNRDGKTSTPRLLHTSDWGNACCVETPEGGGCGLVLNFCALTHVRQGYDNFSLTKNVTMILRKKEMSSTNFFKDWMNGGVPIFVNGCIVNVVKFATAHLVIQELKNSRVSGMLPYDVSIVHYRKLGIFVNGDNGVCLRPVIKSERIAEYFDFLSSILQGRVLENSWQHLVDMGIMEYIDSEEQIEHCVVAINLKAFQENPKMYTHIEVDVNLAVMGITANMIPFADFNQSPRVIYQSAMSKQAIGSATAGFNNRLDSNMYMLHYPQKPLCRTNMEEMLNLEEMDNGDSAFSSSTEAILMIGTYDGFNQEDSILVNKASIQRGFTRITSYKTYFDEINGKGNDEEVFCKVSSAALMKTANYDHLDRDGFAKVGSHLKIGDVVIGKEGQSMELGPDGKHLPIRRDRSTIVKEPGIVDRVCYSIGREGKAQVRIRMRQNRITIEGDKYASRHAQKGTVGRLVAEEDLPFNPETGMRPDIIINPHGFVSRMTIGMLVEALAGKACALKGCFCNATPFRNIDTSRFENILFKHGFASSGHETFYDGRTGRKITTPLFMGIVTYQRLRHLVTDKINSRSRGSKHILTEQPMDGRAKGGGLRVGEMERDCIISHGAASVLHERMFLSSDKKEVPICKHCGFISEPAHNRQFAHGIRGAEPYCRNCNLNNTHYKNMPGAQKLLQQELMAVQCGLRNF